MNTYVSFAKRSQDPVQCIFTHTFSRDAILIILIATTSPVSVLMARFTLMTDGCHWSENVSNHEIENKKIK